MLELGVIADDLTGAGDTGVQFDKFGLCSQVLLEAQPGDWVREADVLVMDTESRSLMIGLAELRVKQACILFDRLGVKEIYKKVDSTLRGNIGPEVCMACEEYQPDITVIAPAFPRAGRTTVGGYQLVNGVPVSRTEFARDPQTPVHESRIPKLLEEYGAERIGILPLQTVMQGVSAMAAAMRQLAMAGKTWIVCDATNEADLRRIVEAATHFDRVLWVGSAGLAEQLALVKNWSKKREPVAGSRPCRAVLVAAGSVSAVTQKQVLQFVADTSAHNIVVDAVAAIASPQAEAKRLVRATAGLLGAHVVLSCSNEASALASAKAAFEARGTSDAIIPETAGDLIARAIGLAVAELVKRGADGLVLTGGETAFSCCRALRATGLEIDREVAPGIPLSWILGGKNHGLPVVTKAGAFGDVQAINLAVAALREE